MQNNNYNEVNAERNLIRERLLKKYALIYLDEKDSEERKHIESCMKYLAKQCDKYRNENK